MQVTASSVGVNPIQAQYGSLHVRSVHMMLSTYNAVSVEEAGMMTHAHTFADRLHVTYTYNVPAVGHARGQLFAATQTAVLEVRHSNSD